jgi:succinoglycan biosynthesis transport protein ExoP
VRCGRVDMMDSQAPTQGGLTGVREVLRVAKRRKILILAPALLTASIAWAIASTTVPHFAATAAITLNVGKVKIVDYEVVSRLPLETSTLRSEIDVIRSRSLNDEVVVKLGLMSNPAVLREAHAWLSPWPYFARGMREALRRYWPRIFGEVPANPDEAVPMLAQSQVTDWLIGNLNATNDNRSLTIVVSFTSESPERAAEIANMVAQTYLDDQALVKTRSTMVASDWLGHRVEKIRQDLEKSEAAVDDYRRKAGLLQVKGGTIPAERLGDLNAQLSSARSERMRAEVKLQTARQSGPESLPDVVASPMIQTLRRELLQINSEIAEESPYSTFYKLKALQDRAAVARKQMGQEMNRILAGLASEVEAARKREAQLTQSFQDMESQLGDAAHSGLQLVQLQREADANRSIYETFLARYKQAAEQESLATPDARLISRAVPPEAPIYPNKLRFLLLGTVGGLAIGGGLAFLRESLDRRVRQASDIESITGIPVFGFLPKVSRWRGLQPQDYPVTDPRSRFCTNLVRIHTALRAPKSSDRKQVILVTSAQPGDGKTSFCTGLARSLANTRMRVLVIDADPYRPQVASAFGASGFPILGPVDEHPVRLGDVVQRDTKSTAHFIAAPNPDDLQLLLHSGGFAALLGEARQAYDVVIIDTPPVMTSADAALIGRFADTRLLLVRWGRTSWDEMTAAVGFLRLCRVVLDGIVMVGVETASYGYGQLASYDITPSDQRGVRPSRDRSLIEAE